MADFESDVEVEGEGESEGHSDGCDTELRRITIGFLATLCVTVLSEVAVAVVSMRGSILNVQPRSIMPYLLYARLRMLFNTYNDYFTNCLACFLTFVFHVVT